jgi:predicted porin
MCLVDSIRSSRDRSAEAFSFAVFLYLSLHPEPILAAEEVRIYGVADAGINFVDEVPGSSTGYTKQVQSGYASGSRLGFRVREGLGGDLIALAVLEGGIELDTGAVAQSRRSWGRQSYVGLEGELWRLTVGRQMTPLYDFDLVFDPTGIRYSSPMLDPSLNGRVDNAVKWAYSFSGISLSLLHSRGLEISGSEHAGRLSSASAKAKLGQVDVSLVVENQNGNTAQTANTLTQRRISGAVLTLSKGTRLYASFGKRKVGVVAGSTSDARFGWVGLLFHPADSISTSVALYHLNSNIVNSDALAWVGFASYRLSKLTDIYVQVGIVSNGELANIGLSGPGTANAGSSQRGISTGVRYRF